MDSIPRYRPIDPLRLTWLLQDVEVVATHWPVASVAADWLPQYMRAIHGAERRLRRLMTTPCGPRTLQLALLDLAALASALAYYLDQDASDPNGPPIPSPQWPVPPLKTVDVCIDCRPSTAMQQPPTTIDQEADNA
jgi:hypothetical protein